MDPLLFALFIVVFFIVLAILLNSNEIFRSPRSRVSGVPSEWRSLTDSQGQPAPFSFPYVSVKAVW